MFRYTRFEMALRTVVGKIPDALVKKPIRLKIQIQMHLPEILRLLWIHLKRNARAHELAVNLVPCTAELLKSKSTFFSLAHGLDHEAGWPLHVGEAEPFP